LLLFSGVFITFKSDVTLLQSANDSHLNDIWGQGTLRVFDRSDTTEVLAYAAEERFELVTTKLDKSGAVVFQEFGDTLVSGVGRLFLTNI